MTTDDWNALLFPAILFYLMFTGISVTLFLEGRKIVLPVGAFIGYTFWLLLYHALLIGLVTTLLH